MEKIPKIIHFCWLSKDEYPELVKKCIESWKKYLPDYEIMIWNTDNFDVNCCTYTAQAFAAKKYAFVSDYIRLYALYNYGGIYLDSDIEVIKSFDDLLNQKAFTCFQNSYSVAAWIFGSVKGNPIFKEFLDHYKDRKFILDDGSMDLTPNPVPITETCKKHGLKLKNVEQKLDYITVYPQDYFCPYDHVNEKLNITENTYSIHYFNAAWFTDEQKEKLTKRRKIEKKYGRLGGYIYEGFYTIKTSGLKGFGKTLRRFFKL